MLSINIHPTRGGVAPLYSPKKPSFRTVIRRHWRGPEKRVVELVCRRTLIVSKGWPTISLMSGVQEMEKFGGS
jgi:hypothetical protein